MADGRSEPGVAVVTGANRGIGREVARQLADRGLTVILGSRDLDRGRRAAETLGPCVEVLIPGSSTSAAREARSAR